MCKLTDIYAEKDVSLSLGRLKVVDLVVDLQPPDASLEAGVGGQEVTRVPERSSPSDQNGLRKRDAREETLEQKKASRWPN